MTAGDQTTTSASLLFRVALLPPDEGAWKEFVGRYGPRVARWCRARGLQDADTEDVCQTVLTTLARRLRSFEYDPARSFRGFIRKVATDAIHDALAARGRLGGAGASDVFSLLATAESREDLSRRLEEEFDLELLHAAKELVSQRVAPQTWEAFRLTTDEGLSGAEAAARLGMRIGTIYQAKSSVMAMLQAEVQRLEADLGRPQAS
jgi:RNA polymerase sigma-70 factor (ECF subfamily)